MQNTWAEYWVYRLNFMMWRLRSFISFAAIYFFWQAVFIAQTGSIFGWQEGQILTYILGVALLRSVIFSSRTIEVGSEINQGNLTNYLLRPLNFLNYWFGRDLADKFLNIVCTVFELGVFAFILRPEIYLQVNLLSLFFFIFSIIIAVILYFYINLFLGFLAFWTPESWSGIWGPRFVFTIILEFFGGAIFPLDILPKTVFNFLMLTPFPYFVYFPLKIYLGKTSGREIFMGLMISVFWCGIWYLLIQKTWRAGLKVYGAEGR